MSSITVEQSPKDGISDDDLDIALGNIFEPQDELSVLGGDTDIYDNDDIDSVMASSMAALREMEQTCEEAERVLSHYREYKAAAGTSAAVANFCHAEAATDGANADATSDASSEDYDYFTSTLQRLHALDPTLTTLELYNPMDFDLERYRDVLGDLDLCGLFSAMATLLLAAKDSPHIRRLDFCYISWLDNPLMRNALTRLLTSEDNRCWDRLAIDECEGIGQELFDHIVSANIKSLHLTHNILSSSCISILGSSLQEPSCSSLRELRLTEVMTPSTMLFLAQGLIRNTTLITLEFIGSMFADKDATTASLAYGLRQNHGLRTLNVSRCDLDDTHVEELILALVNHASLTWLDIANNHCGPRGCDALATLVQTPASKVSGVTLTSCHIDDTGITRLAQSLRSRDTLSHLHLSENLIFDNGISSFVPVLKGMQSLKSLWLTDNMFGNEGAQYLCDAMRINVDLDQLVVDRHLRLYDEIQYFASLNRGGRRLLAMPNTPLAVWPLVLERCQRNVHHFREKRVGRADVIYYLLHGPVIFNNPRQ
jgi:hypothetical protein